jgi:hypothetical protein
MSESSEQEFTVKPMKINGEEQFEKFAEELLKGWAEYKKLDTRMKLLDASIKKFLVDNDKTTYENKYGSVVIVNQNRRVLDRSLIEDIEKYKVDTEVKFMYKSTKKVIS